MGVGPQASKFLFCEIWKLSTKLRWSFELGRSEGFWRHGLKELHWCWRTHEVQVQVRLGTYDLLTYQHHLRCQFLWYSIFKILKGNFSLRYCFRFRDDMIRPQDVLTESDLKRTTTKLFPIPVGVIYFFKKGGWHTHLIVVFCIVPTPHPSFLTVYAGKTGSTQSTVSLQTGEKKKRV